MIADIFDPGQLMDAMRGVQRAYYCPPYHPFVIQSASAFATAASRWREIARRHAALPECHQSFSARLAAFARFMAVPILPGFDPVAYDRAQEQPVPPAPRLALDDTDWAASHGAEGAVIVRGMLKEALV